MSGTLANLQAVLGRAKLALVPYVVRVTSDYTGSSLASTVSSPSCTSLSPQLSGCVSTTATLDSGNASIVVSDSGFSRTVHFVTYAPSSVVVELSRPSVGSLCTGRYQSTGVRVLADGLDVTAIAAITGNGLVFNAGRRTLRPTTDGVLAVFVAGVSLAQVVASSTPVEGVQLRAAAITGSSFSAALQLSASAVLQQLLKQEGDNADVHAALFYSDGTTEPLDAADLLVAPTHPSLVVSSTNQLTVQANPQYFCGDVALVASAQCPSLNGSLAAFIDVPEVISASLSMSSSSCLARIGGEVATSCTGAPQTASLTQMGLRFSDGGWSSKPRQRHAVGLTLQTARQWCRRGAQARCAAVLEECDSTVVTATVDGSVNSSSISICIEKMVGVQVSANFYPRPISEWHRPEIPCTSEYQSAGNRVVQYHRRDTVGGCLRSELAHWGCWGCACNSADDCNHQYDCGLCPCDSDD